MCSALIALSQFLLELCLYSEWFFGLFWPNLFLLICMAFCLNGFHQLITLHVLRSELWLGLRPHIWPQAFFVLGIVLWIPLSTPLRLNSLNSEVAGSAHVFDRWCQSWLLNELEVHVTCRLFEWVTLICFDQFDGFSSRLQVHPLAVYFYSSDCDPTFSCDPCLNKSDLFLRDFLLELRCSSERTMGIFGSVGRLTLLEWSFSFEWGILFLCWCGRRTHLRPLKEISSGVKWFFHALFQYFGLFLHCLFCLFSLGQSFFEYKFICHMVYHFGCEVHPCLDHPCLSAFLFVGFWTKIIPILCILCQVIGVLRCHTIAFDIIVMSFRGKFGSAISFWVILISLGSEVADSAHVFDRWCQGWLPKELEIFAGHCSSDWAYRAYRVGSLFGLSLCDYLLEVYPHSISFLFAWWFLPCQCWSIISRDYVFCCLFWEHERILGVDPVGRFIPAEWNE